MKLRRLAGIAEQIVKCIRNPLDLKDLAALNPA
jgi:hypothetical protein